jgi:hypothetical protein
MEKKKKEVEVSESTSIGDDFAGASAEMTDSSVSAEAKELAEEKARLVAQKVQEDAVLKAKKLATEKAVAEAEAKLAAEETRKREEHAERIAMRQAPVEKTANKLKDQFKF